MNTPKLPKTLLDIEISLEYWETLDAKRFLLFDITHLGERIIAFRSDAERQKGGMSMEHFVRVHLYFIKFLLSMDGVSMHPMRVF